MLKNVKIKKLLKSVVFPVLTGINKLIPKDDSLVLLYSPNLGIEHNLEPLRDYLIANKMNERYQICCCVSSSEYFENDGLRCVLHNGANSHKTVEAAVCDPYGSWNYSYQNR